MLQTVHARLPTIVLRTLGGHVPTAAEVRAVLKVAFLTLEADFVEDPEEIEAIHQINETLWRVTGHPAEPLPIVSPLALPNDDEARQDILDDLANQLESTPARELAYTMAYLFTVLDFAVAPIESTLLDDLRDELWIEPERANELITATAELITPGVTPAPGYWISNSIDAHAPTDASTTK